MELEIYRALIKVNVPSDDAQAVADSIAREIDKRYALHAAQLFTKADGSELKAELIKWCVGAIFAAVGLFAAIAKIWH
jgi:ribosomal protein S3